jgi:hypothetical protein
MSTSACAGKLVLTRLRSSRFLGESHTENLVTCLTLGAKCSCLRVLVGFVSAASSCLIVVDINFLSDSVAYQVL